MDTADRVLTEHRAKIIRVLDAAVAIAAFATIPVTIVELNDVSNPLILACDWIIWLVFVAEYLVMLRLPPQEGGFFGENLLDRKNLHDWRNWVSIAIIVLSFPLISPIFQLVRLVRVVRLARLGRIVRRGNARCGADLRPPRCALRRRPRHRRNHPGRGTDGHGRAERRRGDGHPFRHLVGNSHDSRRQRQRQRTGDV